MKTIEPIGNTCNWGFSLETERELMGHTEMGYIENEPQHGHAPHEPHKTGSAACETLEREPAPHEPHQKPHHDQTREHAPACPHQHDEKGHGDAHGHGHGHSHNHGEGVGKNRLIAALAITLAVMLSELVGAALTGSLTLLVDLGHMLTDCAGLTLAVIAAHLQGRPATTRRTWGWRRAEVISAALQSLLLILIGVYACIEAIKRLVTPEPIGAQMLLAVGIIGLLGNLASLTILIGAKSGNLNLRVAFLEVLNDSLGSVAVIVSAVVMETTGWVQVDSVAALVIAALIVPRAVMILRPAGLILMEATPKDLDLEKVREHLLTLPHVVAVHDLHASTVSTGLPVLTAHVILEDECFHDGHTVEILGQIEDCLQHHHEISIYHTTIQLEPASRADFHNWKEQV
ncbi:cation diffusion facilitator family transporter [Mobiluncus mulieris ATCC 35239]|uniref:Cation diffusion facilitator family transporter n=2 Tax=Mobiluncus mulieris TaxID=2052 RepID=E0QT69_9ACTO|nr:cation diffusion facilitator family transporter [Mobiluncus mulieris ATCC 35243]EFM45195.1 cation diffusion facilitator family transporter [Mobiluncus mulieris ATCC 35239]MCU9994316.1 cation transporter [Mobiluncus mulieris]MCV0002669.1 cation transporter [Mobiluncus mulieris]NMW81427.1 cation transporter [Mobiluncus mulieris]